MAIKLNSICVAIAFAYITATTVTTLFETINQMEDPFERQYSLLDGINVRSELCTFLREV